MNPIIHIFELIFVLASIQEHRVGSDIVQIFYLNTIIEQSWGVSGLRFIHNLHVKIHTGMFC